MLPMVLSPTKTAGEPHLPPQSIVKNAPPALTINNSSGDLPFSIQSPAGFDAAMLMHSSHGTPRSVSSLLDRFGSDKFGSDTLLTSMDLESVSMPRTPGNLAQSLVGLSIDDGDFKDLLGMPLPPTPRVARTPKSPGIKMNDSLQFGDDFAFPSSTTSMSGSDFNFDALNTPKLTKCASPVAKQMSSISRHFHEGKDKC